MTKYESNTTLQAFARRLADAKTVVVTTHSKPDGDAFGAVIALGRALELAGKRVQRWVVPPLPQSLRVLNSCDAEVSFCHEGRGPWPSDEPDAIVIADTGASSQLGPLYSWIHPRLDKVMILDHHLQGDVMAAVRYVDTSAAAACELVASLLEAMGVAWDLEVARAIYAGIASDTGWFHFSNTRPQTLRLAANLLEMGINHAELYQQLEQNELPQKLQLMARALSTIRSTAEGRAVVMVLRNQDFVETGTSMQDTERLVDIPQVVGCVRLVVLISEPEPGKLRISFRSKPGPGAVDVSRLAGLLGGGGHARAAGARATGAIEPVTAQLTQAIESVMADDAN